MRCVFCRQDSSDSKSIEHIVPESLGGEQVLGKGIVCDKCNNYFAREVEKPFLEQPALRLLRFEQGIINKKKKVPSVQALLNGNVVNMYKTPNTTFAGFVDIPSEDIRSLLNLQSGKIIVPAYHDSLISHNGSVLSRFIGKVAIESLSQKMLTESTDLLQTFIDEKEFDPLKSHVRRGTTNVWPVNVRRVYSIDKLWEDPETHEFYQLLNEYDFLLTNQLELYFILILFGTEFSINILEPSIDGYSRWIEQHSDTCPLYK